MALLESLQIWNRKSARMETEKVAGVGFMRLLYLTPVGRWFTKLIFARPWFSRCMGFFANTRGSRKRIGPFVSAHKVDMSEFVEKEYRSFNDFFTREFRPGKRPFSSDALAFAAFAEARYLAFEVANQTQSIPVKGQRYPLARILEGKSGARSEAHEWVSRFEGGPLVIARLCPSDYHRFHYPDDGSTQQVWRHRGELHSVNPIAMGKRTSAFFRNERVVSILKTAHFGYLAYIEVGALGVGRIIQTHSIDLPFKKGDEKGAFLFGASTVIVLGEPGRWKPDSDLLEKTSEGIESWVPLGEQIGSAR